MPVLFIWYKEVEEDLDCKHHNRKFGSEEICFLNVYSMIGYVIQVLASHSRYKREV